ncbi:unnamed protein product [Caenorhabditis angaria]|uniref:Uncharacterized protein n=1 Tax=Caenorhabditis angaria TaxID=860376 RepID=A0A9P1N2Y9_9PELO|nr:unnamed protein product [Caenorhabditis angaria]
MSEHLTVIYSEGHDLDSYIFQKAIRWAEQNMDDFVFWMRKQPMDKIPEIDIDWSQKIEALKRLKFLYNSKHLSAACMNTILSDIEDVAAIIIQTDIYQKPPEFGTLLATLAHFCNQKNSKAVVCIDTMRNEFYRPPSPTYDQWESGPFVPIEVDEHEQDDFIFDSPENLNQFHLISTIYSKDIYFFDGTNFNKK